MKFRAVLVVVLMAVGLLAGCGGSDDPVVSPERSTSAGDDKGHDDQGLSEDDFVDRMVGAIRKAGSAHITMDLAGGGQSMTGEGDVIFGSGAKDSAMDVDYSMSGQEFALRVVDGDVYVSYATLTQGKFFKVDTSDPSDPLAQQFAGMVDQLDPASSYEPFADAVASVEAKGEPKQLDGVDAQPYEVVIDTSKIKGLPAMEDVPKDQLPAEFTYTFFMGPDDLVRRVDFELAGTKLTMTYADYGKVKAIEPPKGDELTTKNPFQNAA